MSAGLVLLRITKQGALLKPEEIPRKSAPGQFLRVETIWVAVKPFARILCLSMIKDAKAAGFA